MHAHVATGVNDNGHREIRRRTDVVCIFADRSSIIRLVGAVLAEQHDEWAEGRRYLGLDVLARSQIVDTNPAEEVTDQLTIQAITA
jgi:putative transposase